MGETALPRVMGPMWRAPGRLSAAAEPEQKRKSGYAVSKYNLARLSPWYRENRMNLSAEPHLEPVMGTPSSNFQSHVCESSS